MDLLKINKNMKNDYKKCNEIESKIEIRKGINNIVLDILNGENATIIRDDRVIKELDIKAKKRSEIPPFCAIFNIKELYWEAKITPELIEKVEKYLEEN